uniref:Receptor-like serine/threonine-protein kinase n=1 Tax=Oryza brachyantha TaxID=4533 RepID=J3MLV6_ORYBR
MAAAMRWPLALLLPLLLLFLFFSPAASASDTILANSSLSDGQTLVSAGGVFVLGFFTPPGSTERFLGIWYKDIDPMTVVWVANREAPVSGTAGSLAVNGAGGGGGGLVLGDGAGRVVWSSAPSNVSGGNNPVAKLMDSGNFVLVGGGAAGEVLWQSFDYPSDTLLPGMKFGWDLTTGLDRYLTTWRSAGDPSPGDYTFKIDTRGAPEGFIRRNGTAPEYRNGPWNGLQFSGEPEMEPNNTSFRFEFVANRTDVYYTFVGADGGDNGGVLSRLVLNQSSAQRYVWVPQAGWSLYWSLPRDQCDQYAHCGAYGVCDVAAPSMCGCPAGFVPASPRNWALRDNSAGCARATRLNCTGDGFLLLGGVKLPDTTNATVDAAITVGQCRQRCQANCSCVAYSASDVRGGGSGCIIWSSPLIDIRRFSYGGEDLFIRLAASDLPTNGDDSSRKNTVVLAVVLSLSGVLLLALAAFFIWGKFFKRRGRFQSTQRLTSFESSNHLNPVQDRKMEEETSHSNDLNVTLFDINTIAFSTDNFASSAKLGEGGFGAVYKGELDGGQTVAVKRLSKFSTQGLDEFKNEVMLIARLQHVNLVRLLGCCIDGEERMLVYEYMENKSLDNFIFDKAQSAQLNWSKRFDIILGIARGLLYLHQDSRFKIIHRDLKAGNILLDRDMNPKISDFGVARIFGDDTDSHTRKVVGTYGYMSPEYAMDGVFSVKSDVFSFGVLVLEIVSGRKNRGMYSGGEQASLLSHAWRLGGGGRARGLLGQRAGAAGRGGGRRRGRRLVQRVGGAAVCAGGAPMRAGAAGGAAAHGGGVHDAGQPERRGPAAEAPGLLR